MPVLTARLLGPPDISFDGRPLELSAGKARALFCYLIVTRQVQSRDRLAGFFWPHVADRNALSSLRTALYEIRRSLGPAAGYLMVDRTRVAFRSDLPFDLDVARLERISPEHGVPDIGALEAAVDAYRGPLVEGLSLPDASDFDDWVFLERERLNNLYLGALVRLGDMLATSGEWDRAVEMARRVLGVDPLREDVHRQLMRFLVCAGQRTSALTQYRTCVDVLNQELGIAPLRATTDLYEQILADEPLAPESGGLAPLARAAATRLSVATGNLGLPLPLVGRQDLLRALESDWRAACGGSGALVMLSGPAGVGKSRLAAEVSGLARRDQALDLLGRCHESGLQQPFGPFVDIIRGATTATSAVALGLDEIWARELARLVPEVGIGLSRGENVPLDGVRDRDRLFESVRVLLSALAERQPVLVLVEDLHWADETSLRLLAYLQVQLAHAPVLLLATYRTEDLGTAQRSLVRTIGRAGRQLTVPPLGPGDTAELLSLLGSVAPPARFGQRMHRATGGNPLFIVETVRALQHQGTLRVDAGRWVIPEVSEADDYAGLPVPETVGSIIDARLDRLSDDARVLLECAAVLRRDFSFDVVQASSGMPAPPALDALDELVAHGLLIEAAQDLGLAVRYDFAHALVRDRVYGGLSAARRQYLHRLAGGHLESGLPALPDRVAYHYLRGGVRDRACAWSLLAGDAAQRVYGFESALEHYGTARELAVVPEEECRALTGIGDAHVGLGQPREAIDCFRSAQALAPDKRVQADLLRRVGRCHERLGAFDLALDAYGEARDLTPGPPQSAQAVRLLDGLATVYIRIGRDADALSLCQEALAWIETNPDAPGVRDTEAWVRNTLGMAYLQTGDYHQATDSLERSLVLKRQLGDRLGEATLLNNLGVVHYHCGEDQTARDYYAASLVIKEGIGDRYGAAIALTNLALMETHLGDLEAAARNLDRARSWAEAVGAGWLMPEIHRIAAQRHLAAGQSREALHSADQALAAAEALGVPAFIGVAHRVLGQVKAAAFGDSAAAAEHLETSLAVFEMLSDNHELAKTHVVLGEVLVADGRLDAADEHIRLAAEVFRRSGAHGRLRRIAPLLGEP